MAWFTIRGLEFIQAVQTSSNSVPLIGHKPTYLRVFLSSGIPVEVSGGLRFANRGFETRPLNPGIIPTPQGSNRRKWQESLNFRLPDAMTAPGEQRLALRVFHVSDETQAETRIITVRFSPRIDLHVYGVVWSVKNKDDGQGAPLGPAAPWSDWELHRRYVEHVYPVTTLTIDPIPGIGTMAPNPQTFGNLLGSRAWATEKLNDLPSGSIIALLDNWDTGGLHGYFWGNCCETQNPRDNLRSGVILAQEIAHCLGVWWHTFDPNSPYPHRDGVMDDDDLGLDLTGRAPQLVHGAFDFMSYGLDPAQRNWGSAFTYRALIAAITGGALGDPADGLPRWHPVGGWEGLGGKVTESPAATAWGKNRLDIVVRGTDGAVWHKYWNGSQWGPSQPGWESLGGKIKEYPAIVSWGSDRLDIFARGLDNAIFHKYWNGSQWGPSDVGWEALGGTMDAAPVAVSWGRNRLDIFVRGADGSVYHKYWNGSRWGPSDHGWESLGGRITGLPAAVSWGPNRIDLFARGLDGAVYHKYWNGSQWGPTPYDWESLGGKITDSPAAASWGPNRLDVFARGTDGAVYHKYWNGSVWGPSAAEWDALGGAILGSPTAVSWAKDRLDVFVKGIDDAVYQKAWTSRDWSPREGVWRLLGGGIRGIPAAVSWAPNRLDLFVRGKDDGIYHRYRADAFG